MPRQNFNLKTLLDIPSWELVQDQLARLTGAAIITIDVKGIPVTKHSGRTDFCSVIRENPVSRKRCHRCDALAGLEAVRLERPYIYLCHCGIVDVAVPIMVGDRYLGSVMFGQVRIPNDDTDNKVERLVNEISSFQAEEDTARKDLLEKYEKLPEMEYNRIVQIAELINSIVEYIVDRAVKNLYETQTYQWMLNFGTDADWNGNANIQELRDYGAEEGLSEKESTLKTKVPMNSVIYPAITYINNHPKERISMTAMAELCHLSQSYFCRVFNKDVGETFVNYVNRIRIEETKSLLRGTDLAIAQIAQEAGFNDTSHYIQLFKRFEGVTPTVYRQYNYK